MKSLRKNNKSNKRFNSLLIISSMMFIIMLALTFTALDVFTVDDETPVAEAGFSSNPNTISGDWTGNYYGLTLGSKRIDMGSDKRGSYSTSLTLIDDAAKLFRHGMIHIKYILEWNSHGTYKDMGGMSLTQTDAGISESASWGRTGTATKTLSASSTFLPGSGDSYKINYSTYAYDEWTWWPPFGGNTDTSVTIKTDITANNDTKAPRLQITNIKNEFSYTKTKEITFSVIDDQASTGYNSGVVRDSIKINGDGPQTPGSENGLSIDGIVYVVEEGGDNNFQVTAEDYFGNKLEGDAGTVTIPYIDTAFPDIVNQIYVDSTEWTNQPVKLYCTAKDADSGIAEFHLAGEVVTFPNPYPNIGDHSDMNFSVTVDKNDVYDDGYVIDFVGNRTDFEDFEVWFIDTVKPTIDTVYFDETWVNTDVMLYIKASDSASGIDKVTVEYMGEEYDADVYSGSGDYTHQFVMPRDLVKTQYTVRAYDVAGNVSDVGENEKVTPNIDITPPAIYTPTLVGYTAKGAQIDASEIYSYEDVSVIVEFVDGGGSELKEIELNGANYSITGSQQEFSDIITKNTIEQKIYTIYLWDNAGNMTTREIEPLKDDTTPYITAIGENSWGNSSQDVEANFWVGLSGGTIQMKRTYLGGELGDEMRSEINENFATFAQGTSFYDESNNPIEQSRTHIVNTEGEEFYHFKIINGAGYETDWIGLNGAKEDDAPSVFTDGKYAVFTSNGARTRIDKTAPQVTVDRYMVGGTEVSEEDFPDYWLLDPVDIYYEVNDGKMAGGNRTDGLNSSGIGSVTSERDGEPVENVSEQPVDKNYAGIPTRRLYKVTFNNTDLKFEEGDEIEIPEFEIIVTDDLGNTSPSIFISPKIDNPNSFLKLELASVKERIDSQTTSDYDTTEQNWINNPIEFTFNKTFGMSGAYLAYYIDEGKGITPPLLSAEGWQYTSMTATRTLTETITIPKQSHDATVFFVLLSGAQDLEGTRERRHVYLDPDTSSNFYIAIDNDSPKIDSYRFVDENSRVIGENDWSPSDVDMYAETSDISTHGSEGSGVAEVSASIDGDVFLSQITIDIGSAQQEFDVDLNLEYDLIINMSKVEDDLWVIETLTNTIKINLLDEENTDFYDSIKTVLNSLINTDYPNIKSFIGENEFSIIDAFISTVEMTSIELEAIDNVELTTQAPTSTFIPQIDLEKPVLYVISSGYENSKGGYEDGVYKEASPTRSAVRITASSNNVRIASGGQIYFLKRSIDDFKETRYTAEPKAGYELLDKDIIENSPEWVLKGNIGENGLFSNIIEWIGNSLDIVEHVGIDIVIISNAGHITHLEYGTVFVDRQSPELIIDKINYIRMEDGLDASGVIPEEDEDGEWTNASLIVEMYVTDNDGSGVNSDSVFIEVDGATMSPTEIRHDEGTASYYIFEGIDTYINHRLSYRDDAGNSGYYDFRPLIDKETPTISLSANNNYNINPNKKEIEYIDKEITITIDLTFGMSSFVWDDSSYSKGNELYSLLYKVDGSEYYNITERMLTSSVWDNPDDNNSFELIYHDRFSAQYKMTLSNDQARTFSFEVRNGVQLENAVLSPATSAKPELNGEEYDPQVKIDTTPPEISEVKVDGVEFADWVNDKWKSDDMIVTFKLDDAFSGVRHDSKDSLEKKSVVLVIRDTTDNQNEDDRYILEQDGGLYSFAMKGYYNYYIEFEDQVGNGSASGFYPAVVDGSVIGKEGGIYGPIKPLIDQEIPDFHIDEDEDEYKKVIYTLKSNDENYDESWTPYNIEFSLTTSVGISGQRLQYQRKSLTASSWPSAEDSQTGWNDVVGEGLYNGVIDPLSGLDEKAIAKLFVSNTDTGKYRFRVISGAGLYTIFEGNPIIEDEIETEKDGIVIKIDKDIPTIEVKANDGDYTAGEWTNETVVFNITVTRGSSGSIVEYSTNTNDPNSWTSTGGSYRGLLVDATTTNATLTVNQTTNNPVSYSFRVRSIAGLSAQENFGEVKIDKTTPNIINIANNIKRIDPDDIVTYPGTNDINYEESWDKGDNASLGDWSNKFIMFRLQSSMGPSGADLYYKRDNGEWEQDDIYNVSVNDTNNISYILLDENQNTKYSFKIVSKSNLEKVIPVSEYYGNVMIDMGAPYMKMTIDGTKSAKWEDNPEIDDLHKWYVENPTITFDVGEFVDDDFVLGYPVSGAKVYYSYKIEDGSWTEWDDGISNNSSGGEKPTLTIGHNADGIQTFRFKIVSGAGNEFVIEDEYSDPTNTEGKDLWTKGLDRDSEGQFTIKVDTTWYEINIEQWLKATQNLSGVTDNDMADLYIEINEKVDDINKIGIGKYRAKRGDSASVEIAEKINETTQTPYDDEKGYGYHLKTVEFGEEEFQKDDEENEICFGFEIFDMNCDITAYFTKEIKIQYDIDNDNDGLDQIMQNGSIKAVDVSHNGLAVDELQLQVLYSGDTYYPHNAPKNLNKSISVPDGIGVYTVEVQIINDDTNDPNYIIHNPDEQMTIVYFDNEGTEESPYEIEDSTDFSYISVYNDPDDKYDFLGYDHINSVYKQQASFEIGSQFQPVYGNFVGEYEGNNKVISSHVEIASEGTFGLFESISGEVKNLGIKLYRVIIDNANNVGFLAGSANSAIINNIYAIGEYFISGEDVKIGGLIGHAYSQTTINNCYTDIAVSNKGNQLSGDVGGMIGLVDDTALTYTYSIGAIEAYDIDSGELNIGQIAGRILSIMEGTNTLYGNKFLKTNLFVNEEIEENNGIGDDNNLTITPSAVEALGFVRFIDKDSYLEAPPGATNIAEISISNVSLEDKYIMNLAIGRIEDLGIKEGEGLGLEDDPFQVNSSEDLEFIDKYVWASYTQTSEINLEGEFETIAAHKVFIGNYNGNMNRINNVVINSQSKNTGFIGKLAGTIENVDIRGLDINVNYTGDEDAYVGGIAGIILQDATVKMVYVLGNIVASAPNTKLHIGGISGYVEGATLIDVLSIANVRTEDNSYAVDIGGTVGLLKNSIIDTVFSLARVEGNYQGAGSVGAAIGTVDGSNTIDNLYALVGNTYAHGQGYDYLAGYVPGQGLSNLQPEGNDQYVAFEALRERNLSFSTSGASLNNILEEVYPLDGFGTMNNPFEVNNVEEFAYINDFLYAHYRIKDNIDFTGYDFTTIGMNAKFTGSISGAMTLDDYLEHIENGGTGRTYRLSGLTDALIYHNAGTIKDLRIEIFYNEVKNTDVTFGAVAIYNSGTIQGVNAEGYISLRVTGNKTAIVGGFVGKDLGGEFIQGYDVQDPSRELSSINNIAITVTASTINAGGFIGRVTGPTMLSYIISEANVVCTGGAISAGTIAGTIFSGGIVYDEDDKIEDTASRVYVNGVEDTKEYGFDINDLV